MTTFLSQLDWRFATKRFNISKPISQDDLDKVLKAIRLAPTSLGLQPFHVYVVQSQELKQKLYPVSKQQLQVLEAPYLLVFCIRLDITYLIDGYVEVASRGEAAAKAGLEPLRQARLKSLGARTPEDLLSWASRSTYIALGFGLAACAELGLDSCPMEGFDKDKVNGVLGLPPHMKSLVYLAIGYRSEGPSNPKVRFPADSLFTFI
ncbi:MAG: NAD(P)H-dependent oxidoreductase [Candidatus Kerfeldbacteria bacterium]|nr:NAD(P)H-dependent oxidoreductase [Candidatus Kerfeldbacteria bacterium]